MLFARMNSAHPPARAARPGPLLSVAFARDRALADEVLEGEPLAFRRMHDLYARRVYGFALKRLGDPAEAEDVVQDVFLEVHRCLDAWEARSSLLTWIFGIAHHQICRRFRKKSSVEISIEQIEDLRPVASEPPSDRRVEVVRILEVCADVLEEEVSPAQREIFDLYYGETRPTRFIAAALGKSNQAVKISLFRTRRAMEARLETRGIQLPG